MVSEFEHVGRGAFKRVQFFDAEWEGPGGLVGDGSVGIGGGGGVEGGGGGGGGGVVTLQGLVSIVRLDFTAEVLEVHPCVGKQGNHGCLMGVRRGEERSVSDGEDGWADGWMWECVPLRPSGAVGQFPPSTWALALPPARGF